MRRALLVLLLASCGDMEEVPTQVADAYTGEEIFALACAQCHGEDGRGGPAGPDLEERTAELTEDDIVDIVRFGSGYMDPVRLAEDQAYAVAEHVLEAVGL